jgi:hypothetical protein
MPPVERWGVLSVNDHIDPKQLAINVLMYDRLIFPVQREQPDRNEHQYWVSQGWDPDLQQERLETLGDLAIPRPWSREHRYKFQDRLLQNEEGDGHQITRTLLADERLTENESTRVPNGVSQVDIIPAYNSFKSLSQDFSLSNDADRAERDRLDFREELAAQAYLITRRLAVPDLEGPELFELAVNLSKDEDFQSSRKKLYDWREKAIVNRWPAERTIRELEEAVTQHNHMIQKASRDVWWKLGFTVFASGLGFLTGDPFVAGGAVMIEMARFATLDGRPVLDEDSNSPAVAFHDMEKRLGLEFKSQP